MSKLIELNDNGNPDLTLFYWCGKILTADKKEIRPQFTHLAIIDNEVFGLNGHQVHKARLHGEYETGLYRVFECKPKSIILLKSDDFTVSANYPNISNLFFTPLNEQYSTIIGTFKKGFYLQHYTSMIRAFPEGVSLNPGYVQDLDGEYRAIVPVSVETDYVLVNPDHEQIEGEEPKRKTVRYYNILLICDDNHREAVIAPFGIP